MTPWYSRRRCAGVDCDGAAWVSDNPLDALCSDCQAQLAEERGEQHGTSLLFQVTCPKCHADHMSVFPPEMDKWRCRSCGWDKGLDRAVGPQQGLVRHK